MTAPQGGTKASQVKSGYTCEPALQSHRLLCKKPHGGSSRNTQDYLTIQQFHLLMFTRTNKDSSAIWTLVFTAEASPRARAHPDDQIHQVWSVHTADCYSALNTKEVLTPATTLANPGTEKQGSQSSDSV